MKQFFQKFQDLEKVEDPRLQVVETPKITAILTYEQILFYRVANLDDLGTYKSLTRELSKTWKKIDEIHRELGKIINQNKDYKRLSEENSKLIHLEFDGNSNQIERKQIDYREKQIREGLKSIEERIKSEGRAQKLTNDLNIISAYRKKLAERKEAIPLIVSPNSPLENLMLYGVLDYTSERRHDTWDESVTNPCIKSLTSKLIDDLDDFDNDDINQIIVFDGLYGRKQAPISAQRIEDARNLPNGIVQIYSTAPSCIRSNPRAEVLKKERDDIVKKIREMGLPKGTVYISLSYGGKVGDLQDEIDRIKPSY